MADESNPFGPLMTPENLGRIREMQFEDRTKGQSFWAQEAGRTGLSMRRELLNQGIALNPEDERALSTRAIVSGAQKRLGDLVKSGELDPLEAQEMVLSESIAAFMKAGDYESAHSLTPALNKIRTYQLEQAKLISEVDENRAQEYRQRVAGQRDIARTPSEIFKNQQQGNMYAAHADLYDRTDPNIRKGGGGGGDGDLDKVGEVRLRETTDLISGVLNGFSSLNALSDMMDTAPWAASAVGQQAASVGQFFSGASNFLKSRGTVSATDINTMDEEAKAIVNRTLSRPEIAQNIARQGGLMGDVAKYRSYVVETAYAMARINDPGGRLSNADFEYALEQLGAVQNAEAAKGVFLSLAKRSYQKVQNRLRGFTKAQQEKYFAEQWAEVEKDYKVFDDKWNPEKQAERVRKAASTSAVANRTPEEQALHDKYGTDNGGN